MNDKLTKPDLYHTATVDGQAVENYRPPGGDTCIGDTGTSVGRASGPDRASDFDLKPVLPGMIDLAHTRFIVTAWPDHRWPLEIVRWIESLMSGVTPARPDYRASVKKQNVVCARNYAIKTEALGSHPDYKWFVFLDRDVRPCPGNKTTRFLALDADVKSCQVEHGNKAAYSWPDDFHEPIWCTSRRVLEAMEPPWFLQSYNEDGTEMAGCICVSFRKKVLEAGFSIAHGGWAEHDRDGSWCG